MVWQTRLLSKPTQLRVAASLEQQETVAMLGSEMSLTSTWPLPSACAQRWSHLATGLSKTTTCFAHAITMLAVRQIVETVYCMSTTLQVLQ